MPFIERKEEKKKKERINKGDIVKVQITKAYQQSHGVQVFFLVCVLLHATPHISSSLRCHHLNLIFRKHS